MSSEWMKVMLEEIARKKAESEQAGAEIERRRNEGEGQPSSELPPSDATARGVAKSE